MPAAAPHPISAGAGHFSSALAAVLYDLASLDEASPAEASAVRRFETWALTAGERRILAAAPFVDRVLLPALSGPAVLRVGMILERVNPEAIDVMPKLRGMRQHIRRTAQLADVFAPAALDRLARAIEEESSRRS